MAMSEDVFGCQNSGGTQTYLVVECIRILLPVQGTQIRSLAWEDSTRCEATKSLHHNYWAHALELMLPNKKNHQREKPMHPNKE